MTYFCGAGGSSGNNGLSWMSRVSDPDSIELKIGDTIYTDRPPKYLPDGVTLMLVSLDANPLTVARH